MVKTISGLSINIEKTKVTKIGALRDRNIPWEGKFGFKCTNDILSIPYNTHDMGNMPQFNIINKIGNIKKLVNITVEISPLW